MRPGLELPPPPWIVAHRGDPDAGLENTLPAIAAAPRSGAVMLEVDVQLTADGELVVFHDEDLRRLGDRPEVVESTPLAVVSRARLRGGESVPTLAEALAALPPDFPVNVELKRWRADPHALLDRLGAVAGRRDRLLVSSFDWDLLRRFRSRHPERPVAPIGSRDAAGLEAVAVELGATTLHGHRRLAGPPLLPRPPGGAPLLVYTVNAAGAARSLLAAGVAGLFTDRPRLLAEALR